MTSAHRWYFDTGYAGVGRSIRISQDVGAMHGEFRQVVPCTGGRRYRLRGRIKTAIEALGSECGANLYLRSMAHGQEMKDCYGRPLDMYFRPFFMGLRDWTLYSTEFTAPPGADALLVSFDMRGACGVAWFDNLELSEVPQPLVHSVIPPVVRVASAVKRSSSVRVVCDTPHQWLVDEVLKPMLGPSVVSVCDKLSTRSLNPNEALIVIQDGKKPLVDFKRACALSKNRQIVVTPCTLALMLAHDDVQAVRSEHESAAPCARIEIQHALTRGFHVGDVIPYWSDTVGDGIFRQWQILADEKTLSDHGFAVLARSVCSGDSSSGHPVLLWRPGEEGGGIAVIDLEALGTHPSNSGEANLSCLLLSNALGRPQTFYGTFHDATFDYDQFLESMRQLAIAHPGISIREEGRTREGRPIQSIAFGSEHLPAFYADFGIHADEWAPCWGVLAYIERLAADFEAGLPWVRALLSRFRFLSVPIVNPDGWNDHIRYIRGIDLNRNYPPVWDDYKAGHKGAAPLSEPETRAVADIMKRERVAAAVTWHETSANTNWAGYPRPTGVYRKYAVTIPEYFRQLIDHDYFLWQPAVWTQPSDPRNYHYHFCESYPYARHYSTLSPYELHFVDSLGIESLMVEQWGNGDMSPYSTPQRLDITGRILDMLFGLQIGLVCRNYGGVPKWIAIPIERREQFKDAVIYAEDGTEVARRPLKMEAENLIVEGELPPGACLVVE